MAKLVFNSSLQTNSGRATLPPDDDEYDRLVDRVALEDDMTVRAREAQTHGGAHFDKYNADLRGDLQGHREVFADEVADQKATIAASRTARDRSAASKSFVTNKTVAPRMRLNVLLSFVSVYVLALLAAPVSEQKTMAEVLIASGRFSFVDHSPLSWFWAAVYCLLPLLYALSKRLDYLRQADDIARALYAGKLARQAKFWTWAWIAVFSVAMGPGLMAAGATLIDPFSTPADWVASAQTVSGGMLAVLEGFGWLISGLLVLTQIVAMSSQVAWILVADGREQSLAREENVRVGETYAHHTAEADRLVEDHAVTLAGLRHIEGLLLALDGARTVYIARLRSDAEFQRGEMASAVTAVRGRRLSRSNVVDLFDRRA